MNAPLTSANRLRTAGPDDAAGVEIRYSAFISYNHRDRKQAAWLHRALETYRLPKRMRGRPSAFGPLGARLPPIFRDREELASSADLADSVRQALLRSHALIVVCSPNSARSKWVNEEIRMFTALGRADRIFCLIVDGHPHASDQAGVAPALECFPDALFEHTDGRPLAADLRPGQDGPQVAKLKLVAGVLGVGFDELRQRDQARRTQQLSIAAAAFGAGFLLMASLAAFALVSRHEAVVQRDIARQKTLTAERTVEFVKSLFEVSDPSESRGRSVTAREILDRGAVEIATGLQDEPNVKADLSTTLGEVYGGLGLFRDGEALIRKGLALPAAADTRARQLTALGDAQARQGDYEGAVKSFEGARALLAELREPNPALSSRILVGLGEAHSALGDLDKSDRILQQALAVDLQRVGPGQPDVARALEALAFNDVAAKRFGQARNRMERALAIRQKVQGPRHPKTGEDLSGLGSIAYLQRRPREAEAYQRRSLEVAKVVIGPDHPDTAIIMNNLARLMLERRDFAGARPLLRKAVEISLAQRDESFDDLAFAFANQAIAERGLGRPEAAEELFRKALVAARVHNHRNLAPILTDLADSYCSRGKTREGLALLQEAAPLMAETYANDPWRSAWTETVRGGCLLAAGDRPAAARTLQAAAPAITARWPQDSLYGARAAELRRQAGL